MRSVYKILGTNLDRSMKEDLHQISGYILGQHFFDMTETFEDVKDYLMEIDRRYP